MRDLKKINKEIRRDILQSSFKAGACHIGSSLSCVEILLNIHKKMKRKDLFIFSKASGVCAYYILLSKAGHFPKKKLPFYLKNYPLADKRVPGVLFSVGSLGHGLPAATGLALADRKRDVYILMSDGETQCGTFYECLLFAHHHKLKNLKIYIDRNFFQACGKTEKILKIEKALNLMKRLFPIKIVKTIKGDGVSFMKNRFEWHYFNLTPKLLRQALKELK